MRRYKLSMFILVMFIFSIGTVYATTISVDPSRIKDTKLSEGDTFSIQVKVQKVADLIAFDFKLGYDTTILDIVNADATPPSIWGSNYFIAKDEINEATGMYWLAVATTGSPPPFDGTTTLVTITFQVTGKGGSVFDLYDTELVDSSTLSIYHRVRDGYFSNKPGKPKKKLGIEVLAPVVIVAVALIAIVYIGLKIMKKK